MRNWRRVLAAVIGVLALSAAARGDMTATSLLDAAYEQPLAARAGSDQQPANPCTSPARTWVDDPFSLATSSLPVEAADAEPAPEMQPAQITSEGQSSLSLCLYTLLGLGLCRSAPWVKKLHLGCIPDWYHHAAPFQIGHSLAVSPDCCCAAPVCFVQPDRYEQEHIPPYGWGTIVSLWRKSQFTPTTLASRAPPL